LPRGYALAVETLAHYILNTMSWFFRLQEDHEADLHEELKTARRSASESRGGRGDRPGAAEVRDGSDT
jgi:hypothetical protein